MPEGSSSGRSRAQTTVRSRNSTKPASVSAAAATPALRGIDLRGHHHTWPGPGNRRRRLRDCPCAMSSNEKHEQPRPGQTQSWPPAANSAKISAPRWPGVGPGSHRGCSSLRHPAVLGRFHRELEGHQHQPHIRDGQEESSAQAEDAPQPGEQHGHDEYKPDQDCPGQQSSRPFLSAMGGA